jgi:hypothetical protein
LKIQGRRHNGYEVGFWRAGRTSSHGEVGVAKKKANTSMQNNVFWEAAAEPRAVAKTQGKYVPSENKLSITRGLLYGVKAAGNE